MFIDIIVEIREEVYENYMGEFVGGGTTMNTPGVDVHLGYPRHKQPHIKHDGFCDSRQV